jgi:hypothetical protein
MPLGAVHPSVGLSCRRLPSRTRSCCSSSARRDHSRNSTICGSAICKRRTHRHRHVQSGLHSPWHRSVGPTNAADQSPPRARAAGATGRGARRPRGTDTAVLRTDISARAEARRSIISSAPMTSPPASSFGKTGCRMSGIAVDPVRQIAIANPMAVPFVSKLLSRGPDNPAAPNNVHPPGSEIGVQPMYGTPYGVVLHPFLSPIGLPCARPPWGYMVGIDLKTMKITWIHPNGTIRDSAQVPIPIKMGVSTLGGPLTTAGWVAFLTSSLSARPPPRMPASRHQPGGK